ncbi:Hypothetical predicted protein [Cloeon dipterum]|uniref:Rho-GAP domain-containing protein n=1 Tax=Cloeon dipterum TaxID=197152 RepID=A0A8S1CYX4_9INSE|nr:Hypothetical predicted protein [Cloeon dipterum]
MVAKYRASQRTPNFLTWETKERIKMLHASNPTEWTFDRLSANFPVSVVAVKQIVKNRWTPRSILEHDNAASKNWKAFKEGKIQIPDENLRAHLMSFLTRDEKKNLPQIDGFGGEQESDVPAEIRKESTVIDVHKEKLEQNVSTFNQTRDDQHTASYKLKIEIPKHKFKEGATYRIKDCYYHSDGELQDDLDAVFAWCASNGMELNAAKCHVMDVTRAKNALHTPYTVGGAVLEYNDTERILGVHVSNDLRWNKHTDIARGKAAKVLSFAARNLYGCNPRVKRLAYLTMVKPLMFYGTPAWHPSTQCNIQKFERVQNRALRRRSDGRALSAASGATVSRQGPTIGAGCSAEARVVSAAASTYAMTTWTERMHQRAATFGNVVTSCGHPSTVPYPRRLEKVKFGVPLEEVCKNDIPGPLLVLILKLNKEAPFKKDVFRAPGHQGNMKKLIHFLQNGRLVNMDNFSVYTIASVLKKFLRKLPGGIFGHNGEKNLFRIIELRDKEEQRDQIHDMITSLPEQTQRLLVLLFGTFRVIATHSGRANTGMSSEALGVSVAPSFFQSCVSDGKQARMEDVLRYKVATRIMKFLIDNFGASNLFGRQNYEFYARITGRILKVEEDWIFSFRYPPNTMVSPISQQEESHSTPALIHIPEASSLGPSVSSLGIIPENNLLQSYTRLSISLEENGLFKKNVNRNADEDNGAVVVIVEQSSSRSSTSSTTSHHLTLEELRAINRYAESTKSLSFLPQVHERQAARMRTRSEWFLSPAQQELLKESASSRVLKVGSDRSSSDNIVAAAGLSVSAESVKTLLRRTSSRDKERARRGSARKNKENGKKQQSITEDQQQEHQRSLSEEHEEGNIHITYKPRI